MHSMLNDTGRSYPFDERGTGYGRGEGVATILLKRLDNALAAGDPVRTIIRGTGVNQDGKTNGITLPSRSAQESFIRATYERAGLDPRSVCYVEAHGTGTQAGDELELGALGHVFGEDGQRPDCFYVGSIKSNIGHLESASGLAGLLKTVLILEKGFIPPNADFRTKKKTLDLEGWKVKVTNRKPYMVCISRV
jgi:acyl transferase domain-containing protein